MKIGIYPGTFDPIHIGHVSFATNAVREAGLEKVVVIAEHEPYRKKPHASWDHRQAMIERATEQVESVSHDYAFASRLSHQHTVLNMLEEAQSHFGNEHEYWFLVGSDTFEHMHKWRDVAHHEQYGGFVVALRDDHDQQWLDTKLAQLKNIGMELNVRVIPNQYDTMSSGQIRQNLATTTEGLAESVAHYIAQHKLYGS